MTFSVTCMNMNFVLIAAWYKLNNMVGGDRLRDWDRVKLSLLKCNYKSHPAKLTTITKEVPLSIASTIIIIVFPPLHYSAWCMVYYNHCLNMIMLPYGTQEMVNHYCNQCHRKKQWQ